jgi:hypothetical protein
MQSNSSTIHNTQLAIQQLHNTQYIACNPTAAQYTIHSLQSNSCTIHSMQSNSCTIHNIQHAIQQWHNTQYSTIICHFTMYPLHTLASKCPSWGWSPTKEYNNLPLLYSFVRDRPEDGHVKAAACRRHVVNWQILVGRCWMCSYWTDYSITGIWTALNKHNRLSVCKF